MTEDLLKVLALHGEMKAQEFLSHVARPRRDYIDFYPVAALLQARYIATDAITEHHRGMTITGQLGADSRETALMLCQVMLPPGQSFEVNRVRRESLHNIPMLVFMTAEGYLRLDELEQREMERRRKRIDYFVSFTVAVLVALLSSYLTHYFASRRLQIERAQQSAPAPVYSAATPSPH